MKTMTRRALGALSLAACCTVSAQGNVGPVRIVSSFPTGSGPDVVVRIVAEKLQVKWQRTVVVEARPGATSVIAINAVKSSPPTGTDLVLVDSGALSVNPVILKNLSYDPDKDLVPVAMLYKTAFFVTVGASSPYKTVRDFAKPRSAGELRFGSGGVGSPQHLHAERIAHGMGTNILHVPFKEASQLYTAVAANDIDWVLGSIPAAGPLVRSGRLRFLAVVDKERSPAMPDVPTLAEAGGPTDIYASSWVALLASKSTPPSVAADINKAVNEVLAQPEVKEKFAAFGFVPTPGPVQQLVDTMRDDRIRYGEVVKRINLSID